MLPHQFYSQPLVFNVRAELSNNHTMSIDDEVEVLDEFETAAVQIEPEGSSSDRFNFMTETAPRSDFFDENNARDADCWQHRGRWVTRNGDWFWEESNEPQNFNTNSNLRPESYGSEYQSWSQENLNNCAFLPNDAPDPIESEPSQSLLQWFNSKTQRVFPTVKSRKMEAPSGAFSPGPRVPTAPLSERDPEWRTWIPSQTRPWIPSPPLIIYDKDAFKRQP